MRERHGTSDAPTGPRVQFFCRLCSRSYFQNFAFISESDTRGPECGQQAAILGSIRPLLIPLEV